MKIKGYILDFKQAHWMFIFISLFFGYVYITITPPLWGFDETSHFSRVYQLAHGEVIPKKDKTEYGGFIPVNLHELINYTKNDLMDNRGNGFASRKDVDNVDEYKKLTDKPFSQESNNYLETSSYSPIAYVGPLVGVFVADIFNATISQTLFIARLGSLLVYIGLVGLAIKILDKHKLRWLFFTVALLPVSVFQASVVTADNVTIGLAILFMAVLVRLLQVKDGPMNKKIMLCLLGSAIMLPLVKVNYIFLSLGLLVLPSRIFANKKIAIAVKWGGLGLSIILALLWSFVSQVTGNSPVSQRPDGQVVSMHTQMQFILHYPLGFIGAIPRSIIEFGDSYIYSATTLVGWNYVSMPLVATIAICMSIFVTGLYAKKEIMSIRTPLLIVTAMSFIGILSIYGVMYLAFNPVGSPIIEGVQGRYFLPFLIPITVAVVAFVPFEIRINKNVAMYLFGITSLVILLLSVMFYFLATY